MSQPAQRRFSFHLSDAAADWAGSALSDVFSDGLLLTPLSGGVTRLRGWLPRGHPRLEARARQRLLALGAKKISVVREAAKPMRALFGRFPVQRLGRFVIVPKAQFLSAKLPKTAQRIVLVQGQAFGTGLHESTRLMLRQLESLAAIQTPTQVLDVGAGSGILGFACLHLGATQVTCVELESAACGELRENRSLNQVKPARLPVICGRYPLQRLKAQRYAWVLGNLVTPVLIELMPRLAAQVASKGILLCSGIHTTAEARLVTVAAKRAGLRLSAKAALKQWFVLHFSRA